MKYWPFLILFCLYLIPLQSRATITLVSMSGFSAEDRSNEQKPLIYAGFTSGCTTTNGTDTCNSCTGALQSGTGLWPCNQKNAYPSLLLTLQVQTSDATATIANAIVKINDTEITPTQTPTLENGILTVQLTWGEICNSAPVDFGSQCNGGTSESFKVDLHVGFKASSSTTSEDVLTFGILGHVATTDTTRWTYTNCPPGTTSQTGNGACYFKVFPGDEKIYADEFSVSDQYPNSTVAGVKFTNIVFFYETQTGNETDAQTIGRITNASGTFITGVDESVSPPIADNRIKSLSNGTKYCLVMANQDITGIISRFTPLASVTATELCTKPTPVVGLLDDKSCFIATAAFGSDMAPEVQSLREFRNKYLLTHSLGRSFVKFYYKHSPFYARMIADSEIAKSVVRAVLWPLLIFARLSVNLGLWTILSALVMGIFCFLIYRNQIVQKIFRGEL